MALNDRGAAILKIYGGDLEMNVNGIGTVGYPAAGYTARKAERSVESGAVGFMETVAERIDRTG